MTRSIATLLVVAFVVVSAGAPLATAAGPPAAHDGSLDLQDSQVDRAADGADGEPPASDARTARRDDGVTTPATGTPGGGTGPRAIPRGSTDPGPPRLDNERPLADAGLDQTVARNATVHLDAAGSRDPDGRITGYRWEITAPDGTAVAPACPTCERTTFDPATTGTYAATLTVTDDDGATATDTLYVTVTGNEPPGVDVGGPTAVATRTTQTYTATLSAGSAPLDRVVWFVDGRRVSERAAGGSTDTITLWFPTEDTYNVTARVVDDGSPPETAEDSLTVTATSAPAPPSDDPPRARVVVSETSVPVGATVTFNGGGSFDPDGSIVSYEWTVEGGPDETGPTLTYRPQTTGSLEVTLTVTDDDGNTDSATRTVAVTDDEVDPPEPPGEGGDGSDSGDGGNPGGGGSGSDDGDCATPVDATIDDVDPPTPAPGDPVTVNATPAGCGVTVDWTFEGTTPDATDNDTARAIWADEGTYNVTYTVEDRDGDVATDTATVTVEGDCRAPDASIDSFSPESPTPGDPVGFDATAKGCEATADWEFEGTTASVSTAGSAIATWASEGTYEVTYTVEDKNGATDTDTVTVTVACTGTVGATIDRVTPSDPAPGEPVAVAATPQGCDVTVDWDFEGTTPATTGERSAEATWDAAGDYRVTYEVTDEDGTTDTATRTVTVTSSVDVGGGDEGLPDFYIEGSDPLIWDAHDQATEGVLRPTRPTYQISSETPRELLQYDKVVWTLETASGDTIIRKEGRGTSVYFDGDTIEAAVTDETNRDVWLIAEAHHDGETRVRRTQITVCDDPGDAEACHSLETDRPDLEIPDISGPGTISPENGGSYSPIYENKKYWTIDGKPKWQVNSPVKGEGKHRVFKPSPRTGSTTSVVLRGEEHPLETTIEVSVTVQATSDTSNDQVKTEEEVVANKNRGIVYKPSSDEDDSGPPGDGGDDETSGGDNGNDDETGQGDNGDDNNKCGWGCETW